MVRKAAKAQKIHMRWLIDLKNRLGIPDEHFDLPQTLEEAKTQSTEAFEEYKGLKQQAPELRSEFLDLLIQQAEDSGDESKAKYLREIKTTEQARDVHKRIKGAQGKLRDGRGVRFVHRIDEDGSVRTIRDKFEMEEEIKMANAAKLMAANESPIRQGKLQELLTDHDYHRWEEFHLPP